jgi:carboxypeptidase PM20D1
MFKKLLLALVLASLIGVALFAVLRAARLESRTRDFDAPTLLAVDRASAADRLAQALRAPTVSNADPEAIDRAAFSAFQDFLRSRFPSVHRELKLETVSDYSLLYTWSGTDAALAPVLLMAHLDVVPADGAGWTHPPFDGVIAEGYVWGRGAQDDKGSLVAILEAVEALISQGYRPQRSVILAFGHDEEVGGDHGAKAIAALLSQRGIRALYSLDEGGAVTRGLVAGIKRPVASLMAGEKGYLSVRLRVSGEGGHSSTPPAQTVIGRLARAVSRIESHPMPARLIGPVDAMLAGLAPDMDWPARIVVANRDWLEPVLFAVLSRSRTTNALIRTTTAPTMFHAGVKDNVLPGDGEAVINFRLLPGDSIEDVLAHLRDVVDDDEVEIAPLEDFNNDAPPASDVAAEQYRLIEQSIREVFPEALVASGLVLGATDSRHYEAVREQGYNFSPMPYTSDDEGRIHGIDERIGIDDYLRMIQFYAQLIRNSTQ